MSLNFRFLILCALAYLSAPAQAAKHPSMPEVLAASSPTDWRPIAVREQRPAAAHSS
jgi:hypothetical protein